MAEGFSVADVEERMANIMADKPGELGLEECRDTYLQEIFDWTDYWSENWSGDMSDPESSQFLTNNLIELWKSYALFEARNKQFKKAVEVFKKAVEDPVVGVTSRLFEIYAEYYMEKSKPASAQKVLIEGLCKQKLLGQENTSLWNYLLNFTKKITQKDDLTFELLYEEIVTAGIELSQTLSFPPGCDQEKLSSIKVHRLIPKSAPIIDVAESKTSDMPAKELTLADSLKLEPMQVPSLVKTESGIASSTIGVSSNVASIPPIAIRWFEDNTFSKTQAVSSITASLSTVWSADQVVLVFQQKPPSLFCAPTQEPIMEGMKQLSVEEKHEVEVFLTTSISSDLENNGHAKNMLDIIEAMWYQHALRERHFDAWLTLLSHAQRREEFAVSSAQYFNADRAKQAEMDMRGRHEQAQRILFAYIHKCRYELLLEQLGIFTTLKVPRCTPLLLQQWEHWSNQARKNAISYLQQQQLQQKQNSAANKSKDFVPDEFGILRQEIQRIQRLVGAILSVRASNLLAQGRVSSAALLSTMLAPQRPSYSEQATSAAANTAYETLQSLAGSKRELSTTSSADDATSPGGERRKTKRRRSIPTSSGSESTFSQEEASSSTGFGGAMMNSYNMPSQMSLSDVAREQINKQQKQGLR